jgi:hypothetical protein
LAGARHLCRFNIVLTRALTFPKPPSKPGTKRHKSVTIHLAFTEANEDNLGATVVGNRGGKSWVSSCGWALPTLQANLFFVFFVFFVSFCW